MHSPSTARSDRFSVAPNPLQFGRHGSLATFHQPCCKHFVADADRSTRTRPAPIDDASLVAPSL